LSGSSCRKVKLHPIDPGVLYLSTSADVKAAFQAVESAFAALLAEEAAAKGCKAALEAAAAAAARFLLGRGLLLIVHLLLGRVVASLLGRRSIVGLGASIVSLPEIEDSECARNPNARGCGVSLPVEDIGDSLLLGGEGHRSPGGGLAGNTAGRTW